MSFLISVKTTQIIKFKQDGRRTETKIHRVITKK
jgi:hypothetical protein